eukprot:SM000323S12624  [mRNA]  locus=s323:36642:38991:- [translate_table: standard]
MTLALPSPAAGTGEPAGAPRARHLQHRRRPLEDAAQDRQSLIVGSVREEIRQRLLPFLAEAAASGSVSASCTPPLPRPAGRGRAPRLTLRPGLPPPPPPPPPQVVDLQDVLLRFTFDNICQVGFDVDPGCLLRGLPEVPFARAFDAATRTSFLRFAGPPVLWKAKALLNVGSERELRESLQAVNGFAAEVIRRRKQELSNGQATGAPPRTDLLSRFMKAIADDSPQADVFLRDIAINFVLAGRDTSAIALSWFFWLLYQHPSVEDAVLSELRQTVARRPEPEGAGSERVRASQQPGATHGGDVDDESQGANATSTSDKHGSGPLFSFEELKQMHYLHAALSESMRLYPPVPIDSKDASRDNHLPDGTFIPKTCRVSYSIYGMGRMESIWGDDAARFRPERWLQGGHFMPASPFKYPVFNAGPRTCLGKDMAYLQMKSIAASILMTSSIKLVPDFKVQYKPSLTLFMKDGLHVTVHHRPMDS